MQNSLKRINFTSVFFALIFIILIGFVTPMKVSAAPKLNKKQIEIKVGKTYKLKVKGTSNKVKWSSSDKSIAKVSKKGVVKAKKVGKTVIKAKIGKKILKCKVSVICNKHQFEEKIIREATSRKSGEKCKVCKVCGFETEHEEIPVIDEEDEEDEEESDTEYNSETRVLTETEVKNKLAELKKKYPNGTKVGICGVYANLIAQEMYGTIVPTENYDDDFSKLKVGDIIVYDWKIGNYSESHAVVVTNVDNNYICVTDSNAGSETCYWDEEDSPRYMIKDGKLCGVGDTMTSITSVEIWSYYSNN